MGKKHRCSECGKPAMHQVDNGGYGFFARYCDDCYKEYLRDLPESRIDRALDALDGFANTPEIRKARWILEGGK